MDSRRWVYGLGLGLVACAATDPVIGDWELTAPDYVEVLQLDSTGTGAAQSTLDADTAHVEFDFDLTWISQGDGTYGLTFECTRYIQTVNGNASEPGCSGNEPEVIDCVLALDPDLLTCDFDSGPAEYARL